jgi:hypothetical protein
MVALVRRLGGHRRGQGILPVEPLTCPHRRQGPRYR